MIISHVIGGLGNQMFQYATARALSLQNNVSLKLDLSDYSENSAHNGFELDRVFGIDVQQASKKDFYQVLGWRRLQIIRRLMKSPKGRFLRNNRFIKETKLSYWSGIETIPNDCYLIGYWQSEKYFSKYSEIIKSDFTFSKPFDEKNLQLAEEIQNCNSVSMHVRRGDYLLYTKSTYYNCPPKYYKRAISYLSNKVENPTFFIFSDDPEWVRSNFSINFPSVIVESNQGRKSYNDMRLMSLCKHHIIANSSFSWWGAWLSNTNIKNKIIIAPELWFRNSTHNPSANTFKLISNAE